MTSHMWFDYEVDYKHNIHVHVGSLKWWDPWDRITKIV